MISYVVAGMLVAVATLFGVRRAALTVVLIRPPCDPVFGWVDAILPQSMGPGIGGAINLLVIGLAVIVFVHVPRVFLSPSLLAWCGFLLAAFASLIHGTNPAGGTRLLATLTTYAAVFSLPLAIVRSRDTAAECLWIAYLSSVVPTAWAVVELAMVPDILFGGGGRLQGSFAHPNIFAFFIVSVIALILFLMRSTLIRLTRVRRRMLYAHAVALLILLLCTKTRSAWIAMAVILIGYAIFIDRRWFAFIVVLPAALLIPGIADRMAELETGNIDVGFETLNSLAWREVLWENTLQWMADNPSTLLGHGLDLYESYLPLFFPRGTHEPGVGPHNTLLQIYFEMGLIGLTAFLAIFVVLFGQLYRGCTHERDGAIVIAMLCIGYLIVSYADNLLGYLNFEWFFWFVLGTVLASMRIQRHLHRFGRFAMGRPSGQGHQQAKISAPLSPHHAP
jgi:O-antigen ligase